MCRKLHYVDASWASSSLLTESSKRARGVLQLPFIVDDKYEYSFVCATGLLRWCANAQPTSWLRGMQPSVTAAAAAAHDARVRTALTTISRASLCTAAELALSVAQARLPISGGFGGGSVTSAQRSATPHFTSSTARAATSMRATVPGMAAFSFASDPTPFAAELRSCLTDVEAVRLAVTSDHRAWDANFIDHSTFGDKTFQYHPCGLPTRDAIPSAADLDDPDSKFFCATRYFAAVYHHADWISLYRAICAHPKEATGDEKRAGFFISTCQLGRRIPELPACHSQPAYRSCPHCLPAPIPHAPAPGTPRRPVG